MQFQSIKSLFLVLCASINVYCYSQAPTASSEIGIFIGDSYYRGELNKTHFTPFNLALGFFYRYNFDDRTALKTSFNYGTISGDDAISSNSFSQSRNFHFKSKIFELSTVFEFNFLEFSHLNDKGSPISPFIFIGLGYFYHNPQGGVGPVNVDLSTLQTEGRKYRKFQASIPLGLGLKFHEKRFGFSIEWGIRKTYTDYLDDVSAHYAVPQNLENTGLSEDLVNVQRGDVATKDWLIFTGITLFVNLNKNSQCRRP